MTGIGMAAASGKTVVVSPLTVSVQLDTSLGTLINVSGASGDLHTWSGGGGLISYIVSGGVPPYSAQGIGFVSDGNSGGSSCSMGLSSDGLHQTIFWTGAAIGDLMFFHLTGTATDSVGTVANDRYPTSGSVVIKRTS